MTWWDRALYVDVDAQSLREAEDRERLELLAQSCVVRHARVEATHVAFWKAVDARRTPPRLRLVTKEGARG
jgi:hypothetical protein